MIQRVETQRSMTCNITTSREVAANVTRMSGVNTFTETEVVANAFIAKTEVVIIINALGTWLINVSNS